MNSNTAYIKDMLENIGNLESFLKGVNKEGFFSDLEKQFAVTRALEVIGEASGKLSEEYKKSHAEIDWRGLKSMRNLISHEYAYVDIDEIWKAVQTDIPDLKKKLLEAI